jgi:hypothetical protein
MALNQISSLMNDPADQSQFINELLEQQDSVILQLDDLLVRIEAVLKVAVVANAQDGGETPAEDSATKKVA